MKVRCKDCKYHVWVVVNDKESKGESYFCKLLGFKYPQHSLNKRMRCKHFQKKGLLLFKKNRVKNESMS